MFDIERQKEILTSTSKAAERIDNVITSLQELSGTINEKTINGVDMSVYLSAIDKTIEELNNIKINLGHRYVEALKAIKDNT